MQALDARKKTTDIVLGVQTVNQYKRQKSSRSFVLSQKQVCTATCGYSTVLSGIAKRE